MFGAYFRKRLSQGKGWRLIFNMKTKIYLIGTASGIPTWNRYTESVALKIGDNLYLLDAGEPCSASMVRLGINYNRIRAVFISHMDPDHFAGLPMLIQTMELSQKRNGLPLKIFLPPKACRPVKEYLRMMYLMPETLSFKLEFIPLKEGEIYKNAKTSFSVHRTNHLKRRFISRKNMAPVPTDSFAFSATMPDKRRLVYTGDIAGPRDLDAFIDKTDLLLVELAHFRPEDLFACLAGKKVGKIVCLHIHPDWNDREKEILRLGRKYLKKNVIIGTDGMKIGF